MRCDDSYREYMYNFIKRVCEEIGPRSSATSKEYEGLELIETEIKTVTDESFRDNFKCSPGAYPKGNIYIALILWLASYVVYLVMPTIAIILIAIGVLSIFSELLLMKEAVDWLFPKKSSWNVFGKIKPSQETRKIVIMGGHADSAYEFPWYPKYRSKIVWTTYSAIAPIVVLILSSILKLISLGFNIGFSFGRWYDWIYLGAVAGGIWTYYAFLGYFSSNVVDGANDNLSGVAVSLAVGKYLSQNRPKYVETWFGAFGCEECGQRGSKAFVKQHAAEIKNSNTLIPESIGAGDVIMIVEAEDFCFTDHSKPLVAKVELAAKQLAGKNFSPVVVERQPYADTDAMRFSEKGFEAMAFLGLNKDDHFPEVWHEKADTYTCINKKIIGDVAEIILQFIENLDNDLK